MGRKQSETSFIGQITSGISVNTVALRTIVFVREQLPIWRDDPDRPDEQSENKLNLQLCRFLDTRAQNDFPMVRFDHEEYQSGHRSVDLSASLAESIVLEAKPYTIYDPILVLEGKRLPAPSLDREKEYVTGSTPKKISGGIQRLKLGLHGEKFNIAAMIGYVQDRSARHWYNKINEWISDLISDPIGDGCVWIASETLESLKEDKAKGIASYRSVHSRTAGDEIELHHLWIAMNEGRVIRHR